ncbi:hypothetical protein BJF83_13910 [Nocardiopsis sp. CNR-923]|uniref:hypothetical protein n=1 Tax=Nocardiopsis sp. CNR-923 TaxID=1904965 RepID=UPI000968982E|nr:hypothetical protein [Nocardiopsis sp. CNR-923]OLT28870.1 hypothetical protein BJF83_13910 [Nocardiopsis sp. CNR-923]
MTTCDAAPAGTGPRVPDAGVSRRRILGVLAAATVLMWVSRPDPVFLGGYGSGVDDALAAAGADGRG